MTRRKISRVEAAAALRWRRTGGCHWRPINGARHSEAPLAASVALSNLGRAKSLRSGCDLAATGQPSTQPVLRPLPNRGSHTVFAYNRAMLALGQMLAICPDRRSVGKCETSALFATHIAERHRRAGRVLGHSMNL